MFEGGELGTDSADTTMDAVYVLDQGGEVRRTVASGIRVFFPNIPDVGSVRQRLVILKFLYDFCSGTICYTYNQ